MKAKTYYARPEETLRSNAKLLILRSHRTFDGYAQVKVIPSCRLKEMVERAAKALSKEQTDTPWALLSRDWQANRRVEARAVFTSIGLL